MPNSNTDSNKFHGKPCIKCGATLRYTGNKACVSCTRKADLKWKRDNIEKRKRDAKVYYKNNRKKINETKRCWAIKNREKVLAYKRKIYADNRDKIQKQNQRWVKNNPDKANAQTHRYRARKRQAKSEPYDFKAICKHYGNKCLKCGKKGKMTIDHINPLSKGGNNIASNIQPLCHSCNSGKCDKNIDYRPDAGPLRWIQKKLFG